MNTLGLVIEREYTSRVKKKSFILLTILMPFLFVGLAFVPMWLSTIKDSGVKKIAVIDQTGLYAPDLKSSEHYQFQLVGDADTTNYQTQLGNELFAILQITGDLSKNPKAVSLTSGKQTPMDLQSQIENTLSEKVTQQKLDELAASGNVDQAAITQVRNIIESGSHISLSTLKWSKSGDVSETSTTVASIVGMTFTILIYMFIMIYGSMVMQAVMEEKRSRIVEVMISSMKPVNLLIGKIIAIGLVGLTQLLIWAVMVGVLFLAGSSFLGLSQEVMNAQTTANGMEMAADIDAAGIMSMLMTINWVEIAVFFIVYFIGGFVLYASIFAVIGASVDNEQDVQQFMMPVTILLLFAFYAGFYSVQNPDGPLAYWCSFIPFTSPIVMMVRIPFGIPFWQELLSVALLYGTFILISYLAAKIYRVGILMYGKKPTLKEIIKWATYK
ncbi:MAG: ABC transporter permease [Petrimonas sp.]|nr:ABC transporter permease [Petrimonas sp.]